MNRRGFLQGILAAGVAPYVSTMAGVLMPGRATVIEISGASMRYLWDAQDYMVIPYCGHPELDLSLLQWARDEVNRICGMPSSLTPEYIEAQRGLNRHMSAAMQALSKK